MRRFFVFIFCLCTSAVAANSSELNHTRQEVPASPAAKSEAAQTKDGKPSSLAATKADYSKEPFVGEQVRARYKFENDGTGREENTIRIRVQSEAGVQRWGQLRFGYNSASESFEISHVRVIKQDGTVVTAGADAVQELSEPIQRLPREACNCAGLASR
jgi:hypothetical protein